jgi:hypothetical protein
MTKSNLHIAIFDYAKSEVSVYKTNLDSDAYFDEIEDYIITMGHDMKDIKYMVSLSPITVNNYFN